MIFIFEEAAGSDELILKGETYKYLVKVRRHVVGDPIALRSPQSSEMLYTYRLESVDGREARLVLMERVERPVFHPHRLHIGWCAIDSKSVEKVLPQLNELGVAKISFIGCERSQKHFRHDYKRYERILMASMQQCGRSVMMEFGEAESVEAFIAAHPDCIALDFCEQVFDAKLLQPSTVLIGPEGGWCDAERERMDRSKCYRLATPTVLRSETAAVAVSSAVLLR